MSQNESKPVENPTNGEQETNANKAVEETKASDTKEENKEPSLKEIMQTLGTSIESLTGQRQVVKDITDHEFWKTQPVPQKFGEAGEEGEIEKNTVENVRKTPYTLFDQFEWADVDLTNTESVEEIYQFLAQNYVEDEDGLFRFDYSKEFLQWALTPPNYYPDWIFGVRVKKSRKIVGFITAIPVQVMCNGKKIKMAEVNFLCVHKKLRSNRLAPVLIKEVTRRVNLRNIWQAIYTSGTKIPTPITQARYYHRSLNPKKLVEIKFSSIPPNSTISRMVKLNKVPEEPQIPGIREFKAKDVSQVTKLLQEYLSKFKVHLRFNEEDVKHWLLPRKDVVYSYVVEQNKKITDLVSFYCLPSSVLKNPKYTQFRAAYSYYNVATTVSFKELISDALTLAVKENFDVYNALNILDNFEIFEELKFNQGDGNLHYYFYNWRLNASLLPSEMGVVLL